MAKINYLSFPLKRKKERKMSLECITGPMCSGKTSTMLKKMTLYADCVPGSNCVIINSSLDKVRDQKEGLSSHSSGYKGVSSKIDIVSSDTLKEVNVEKYSHIGIDECQFFNDLKECVEKWLKEDKHVVVCGLDGTAEMKEFGQVSQLLPLADEFVKLSATCSLCVKEVLKEGKVIDILRLRAPFTKKIGGVTGQVVDIGGTNKYIAVCREHFYFSANKNEDDK
jgi:thymidine kinase